MKNSVEVRRAVFRRAIGVVNKFRSVNRKRYLHVVRRQVTQNFVRHCLRVRHQRKFYDLIAATFICTFHDCFKCVEVQKRLPALKLEMQFIFRRRQCNFNRPPRSFRAHEGFAAARIFRLTIQAIQVASQRQHKNVQRRPVKQARIQPPIFLRNRIELRLRREKIFQLTVKISRAELFKLSAVDEGASDNNVAFDMSAKVFASI